MDKKNLTIGVLLLAAAFGVMLFGPKAPPSQAQPAAAPAPSATTTAASPAATTILSGTPTTPNLAAAATSDAGADDVVLENNSVRARFTAFGGGVRDVAFVAREAGRIKYYAASQPEQPFIFNELHADPMLAMLGFPGLDRSTRYTLVNSTRDQVVYRAVLDGRLEVTRTYTLSPNTGAGTDPYLIQHVTSFRNLTGETVALPKIEMALGTAAPINATDNGLLLTTGYSDGNDTTFTQRSALQASGGFFGLGAHAERLSTEFKGNVVWGVVGNQHFASILTPAEPAAGMVTRRVKLDPSLADTVPNAYGLTGAVQFDVKPLAPNGTAALSSSLYVGPKEFRRLTNTQVFKQDQDKVMQFSRFFIFRWCSQILSTLMSWYHSHLPATTWGWGFAIILATLTLKIVFLPLTFAAARSMKRMQKIQPLMVALREKHKDNPRKMQEGMMELYREHKVNPLGGCIPMLLPMPFFMGFFFMLPSTAELRFAPFLWAADLSAPDTITHVLGFPINILPVLMGATMVIQMRLVPQPPTADNLQLKMMKFMPYLFTAICYNSYACSLAIYSTANGIFTIGQQMVINRMKDDGDPATHPGPGGRPTKNVTPRKKG
jgi:YidC/Oxa1 family membrane protein insertase